MAASTLPLSLHSSPQLRQTVFNQLWPVSIVRRHGEIEEEVKAERAVNFACLHLSPLRVSKIDAMQRLERRSLALTFINEWPLNEGL